MREAAPEDAIYVFNHLQRTAGGAMTAALGTRLRMVLDYQAGPTDQDLAHWLAHPIMLDRLRPGDMLIGHYTAPGGRLHERYPSVFESPRYRLVTFLREPLDWVESQLRYFGCAGLDVHDEDEAIDVLAGTFARMYGLPGGSLHAHPLDAYWFAGAYSRTADDARRLLHQLGIDAQALRVVNAGPESGVMPLLDAGQRARYRRVAAADFELYNRITRRR